MQYPSESVFPGIYSPLFLAQKKSGAWRPVIDLRDLNRYIRKHRFKIDSLHHQFSQLSGLSLNTQKTMALNNPVPPSTERKLRTTYNFLWANSIPYLGIQLTSSINTLYQGSYPPLFRQLREDLQRWADYSLSWFGRIYSIEMTFLPRILFYFRTLPIAAPRGDLQLLQSDVLRFICGNK